MSIQEILGFAMLAAGFLTSVVLRSSRYELVASSRRGSSRATRLDRGGQSLRRPNFLRNSSRPPAQVCRT